MQESNKSLMVWRLQLTEIDAESRGFPSSKMVDRTV